jgi:glutamyl-tRNA reductase
MPLFAVGLNHHTAPVAIREHWAFPQNGLAEALGELTSRGLAQEAALLSTCNRTELYCSAESPELITRWLADRQRSTPDEAGKYLFALPGEEAIKHVFRVASGLDSMVLGEAQILGQLKEAVRIAEAAGTLGTQLHKLFQSSFTVAKEVRTNTAIGSAVISMAAAAVRLSTRIFERMDETKILFVGAGEMVELCATHFAAVNPRRITIANRTRARAEALATRFNADILPLEGLGEALPDYDIVLICTASPLPLIGRGAAERAIRVRRHRPMVMVDLSVPRNIEPEVARVGDIFLYTVDDLEQIVSTGLESRQAAVAEAETLIHNHASAFNHWLDSRETVPTIRQLRDHAEDLRASELAYAQRLLARGEAPEAVLDILSRRLTNKLLHGPSRFLNQAESGQATQAVQAVQQVFQLLPEAVSKYRHHP